MVASDAGWRKRTQASLPRAVGWLLLGLLLVTLIGVPLPQRKRLASDIPFPCQDHPCGCSTAAACWQNCCCFTDSEKLAWARKRGVTPPEHVIRRAAASATLASAPGGETAEGGEGGACRLATRSRVSCCSAAAGRCEAGRDAEAGQEFGAAPAVVLIDAYQRCRGLRSILEQLTENWIPPAAPRPGVPASLLYCLAAFDQRPIDQPRMPEPPVP